MVFKDMFRKASVALIAGAYVLFVEAAGLVQTQTRVIAGSPPDGSGAPNVTTAARIVLHDVRFQTHNDTIDKCSLPILDYGVRILKRSPEPFVYVEVRFARDRRQEHIDGTLTNRRVRAVVNYFEKRGISASRVVLLDPGKTLHIPSNQQAAEARNLEQNVGVVQLDLANRSDGGGLAFLGTLQ
jgi:hypothetical protein